jgi:hypothetical protein
MKPTIITHSGLWFDFNDPQPDQICIEDIAHALAHICRYAGHSHTFYSVAEHSVRVSFICAPGDELWGLLHDASEAYMGDIVAPLKRLLPDYQQIELKVQTAILQKFGLPLTPPSTVKWADMTMLVTEAKELCHSNWDATVLGYEPLPQQRIGHPLTPAEAKDDFITRYYELTA